MILTIKSYFIVMKAILRILFPLLLLFLGLFGFGCTHRAALLWASEGKIDTCGCSEPSDYLLYPDDIIEIVTVTDRRPITEYPLQVGDLLSLVFPAFTGYNCTQPVRPDGTVSIPRHGSYHVAGLAVDSIQNGISRLFAKSGWNAEFLLYLQEYDAGLNELKQALSFSPSSGARGITVRPDGFISLPLMGDIPVGGRTLKNVSAEIRKWYGQHYPRLSTELHLNRSRGVKVFIYGEARLPGGYDISQTGSMPELFARAGGLLPSAETGSVIVLRVKGSKVVTRKVDLAGTVGRNVCLTLCPGDIVFVPKRTLRSLAELQQDLARIFFFNGFGVGLQWDSFLFNSQ
jgi:polysaccharide export outer membrane protein